MALQDKVKFRKPREVVCWCGKHYAPKDTLGKEKTQCSCGMIHDVPKHEIENRSVDNEKS